jgi:hypothetical protein
MTNLTIWDPNLGERPANLALTNNFSATTNPLATSDSSKGYSVGSVWVNVSTKTTFTCQSAAVGAAVWAVSGQGAATTALVTQGAQNAQTVSATLTAANLLTGIITVAQGAAGASALQLPLATDLDAALPAAAANQAFDFSLINISTVAAESASITTNTGWTLVGDMDVAANSAATTKSAGRFRARKTGTGAWTLYRLS